MVIKGLAGMLASVATMWSAIAAGAPAQWHRADTEHFIIYSNGSEASLRQMGDRLEKLDLTQRKLTGTPLAANPMRATVYVLPTVSDVEAALPGGGTGVLGFYNGNTRGPFAVTPRGGVDGKYVENTLYHELTHHFMFQNYPSAYPVWYSEGFAELLGSARINDTASVVVGNPQQGRLENIADFGSQNEWMPVRKIVAAHNYGEVDNIYLLYAEGWLLTHYLTIGGAREGQLPKYLKAINEGKSLSDAAKLAFGDSTRLNDELFRYRARRTYETKVITFPAAVTPKVTVAPVSAAQGALMFQDMQLSAGVLAKDGKDFAGRVRAIAANYPKDPFALRIRAEADRNAGDFDDMIVACRSWIAVAPQDPFAMTYLAVANMARMQKDKVSDAAKWDAERGRIATANKLAPDQPVIMRAYFDSFLTQGKTPSAGAQRALYRALELVPNDDEVRYELATDYESRGLLDDAISVISIAAYGSPDDAESTKDKAKREKIEEKYRLAGSVHTETPREMLDRLLKKKGGTGIDAKEAEAKKS